MPAATTHNEFAKDVFETLTCNEQNRIHDFPMFFLGAQGPDLFFFSNAAIPHLTLKPLGHYMHTHKIEEVIFQMLIYASFDEDLMSYVYGYLCHYALDTTCHPIICSYAKKWHETTGIHEGEAHISIEAALDNYILSIHNKSMKDYAVDQEIQILPTQAKKIARMYHFIFQTVYGFGVAEKKLEQSAYDMVLFTRLLNPNCKRKYQTVYKIENLLKVPHGITGLMLNQKDVNDSGILNTNHETYDQNRSESFMDLYQMAIDLATKLIQDPTNFHYQKDFIGE